MTDHEQQNLDVFREMNRYADRHEDYPSDAVYKEPRRTLHTGWAKFHAHRDCGSYNVAYTEVRNHRPVGDKYEYRLRCWSCGYTVPEDEVLFIGGDWYREHGWEYYGRPLEDMSLNKDRVLDLGPDPDRDELVQALEMQRIERQSSNGLISFGLSGTEWYKCAECGHDTPIKFNDRCRMCYEGEWTESLQESVNALSVKIRERLNDSYRHRLPSNLDPLEPVGIASERSILWRRSSETRTSKLVEVYKRLEDYDTGEMQYLLTDPERTEEWLFSAEELGESFWDTRLYNDAAGPAVEMPRINDLYEAVRDDD